MIKIESEKSITELGKRNNNEDYCAFISGHTYIVCDGVGGNEKGEIASNIVVKTFAENYIRNTDANVEVVLQNAEKNLTDYSKENPTALGMATTLTFCQIKDEGVLVAWVGDSRLYQFRNGEIVFSTTDHSWVNEAIRSGIITANEGINHPKSNVITRAIQGNHKPTQAESVFLTDIKKDDLFMLCTDGILETWDDEELKALFKTHNQVEELINIINEECSNNSRDNYTAIIFKVYNAEINNTGSTNINTPTQENESSTIKSKSLTIKKKSIYDLLKMRMPFLIVLIITLTIGILSVLFYPKINLNNEGFFKIDASKIDQIEKEEIKDSNPNSEKLSGSAESNTNEHTKSEQESQQTIKLEDKIKVENEKIKAQSTPTPKSKEKLETNINKEEKAQKKSDSKNKPK